MRFCVFILRCDDVAAAANNVGVAFFFSLQANSIWLKDHKWKSATHKSDVLFFF